MDRACAFSTGLGVHTHGGGFGAVSQVCALRWCQQTDACVAVAGRIVWLLLFGCGLSYMQTNVKLTCFCLNHQFLHGVVFYILGS